MDVESVVGCESGTVKDNSEVNDCVGDCFSDLISCFILDGVSSQVRPKNTQELHPCHAISFNH